MTVQSGASPPEPPPGLIDRHAAVIRWLGVGGILLGLALFIWSLDLQRGVSALQAWIRSLGVEGMVIFAAIYVLVTISFLPGSIFTIAAGALFGPLWGTIVVSIGSIIGAACAFLIARYLARQSVARLARRYRRLGALDRAIARGGWRVVALLRISPAIPFNLQNYVLGVTPIGFGSYLLSSWLAMLPGTFFYVYLGYLGFESIKAAAGQNGSINVIHWIVLGIGLIVTIAVTIYITYLARRAIARDADTQQAQQTIWKDTSEPATGRASRGLTLATLLIALLVLAGGAYARVDAARVNRTLSRWVAGLFGPPQVTMRQAYKPNPQGPTFSNRLFDQVLHRYVDDAGFVNYPVLAAHPQKLDAYIASLKHAPFDRMGRNQKLALLLNAYNAFTLRLILDYWDHGKLKSIKDIPADQRWQAKRWHVGKHVWSLDQIEHQQIRPKFAEPRIHFALVCAAYSCPPLRNHAYQASKLNAQLNSQAQYVHHHPRWFKLDLKHRIVYLTELYNWYGSDFRQFAPTVLDYAARFNARLRAALAAGTKFQIRWIPYDWKLNSQANEKAAHR